MIIFIIILSSLPLLFNGIKAIYGGVNLILYHDKSSTHLSPNWLKHTSSHNFYIPGIILFIANGLFSIFVLISLLCNWRYYYRLVIVQGAILVGWIIIQIFLIQNTYFIHGILGGVGIAIIILGWIQKQLYNANK